MYDKISIIVPVYNVKAYLSRCLESIINQSYRNLEIIVIDDGSNDSSQDICDDFIKKDKRLIVVHQKNSGVSVARNNGLKIATGKYISFIDSDDYIETNMIEVMVNEAKNNVDLVICNLFFENDEGKYYKTYNSNDHIIDRSEYPKEMYLNHSIQGYMCNKLYKRDLIYKHNILFNNNYSLTEDDLFNYQVFDNNKKIRIKYINKKLYHYVLRKNSASASSFSIKNLLYLKIKEEEINILNNNDLDSDFLMTEYVFSYKRMKYLAKIKKIKSDNFRIYREKYYEFFEKINYSILPKKLKIKYIIAKYIPISIYFRELLKIIMLQK